MRSFTSVLLIVLGMHLAADADEPRDPESKQRLEYMIDQAKAFSGVRQSDDAAVSPMDQPLLRWTNPYSNVKDGVLVGWVDEVGKPMAVAQIYLLPNTDGQWGIEFQSLSQHPLKLSSKTISWRPRKPGVQWKTFPGKPAKVSKSAAVRLTQMRSLARRFRGDDTFGGTDNDSVLRLMTNPMIRYEDPANDILDGAVFALVHGTDPEMIIQVELRQSDDKPQFYYALAPMTGYALRGFLDGVEVYNKPRHKSNTPDGIFWQQNLTTSAKKSPGFLERLLNSF